MNDYFLLQFVTTSFYKNFIDFLIIIANQDNNIDRKICIRLDLDKLTVIKEINKHDNIILYLTLELNKNSFIKYEVSEPYEIKLNANQIIKSCNNRQKNVNDKIELIYKDQQLSIIITNINELDSDINPIINPIIYKPQQNLREIDIKFKDIGYNIKTIKFMELKRKINVKGEIIEINMFENKFIIFKSRTNGMIPFQRIFGTLDNENDSTYIKINTIILNIFTKINYLCTDLIFYQTKEKSKIVKVAGLITNVIDKNKIFGNVNIIIFNK